MPTTNDTRAIKINANNPSKMIWGVVIVFGFALAGYLLGCKFSLLPNNFCGPSDIKAANVPTPVPSQTPLPLVLAPTPTLPACGEIDSPHKVPYCGFAYGGSSHKGCNSDGTAVMTISYTIALAAASNVKAQLENNVPVDTDPPGACQWVSIEPIENSILFIATMKCMAPSETVIQISGKFAGTSCQVPDNVCWSDSTLVSSLLNEKEAFYCMPNDDFNISQTYCSPGQFYDPANQCCGAVPNSGGYSCPNPQESKGGFTCDISYEEINDLKWTMPACVAPTPTTTVQDNKNGNDNGNACVPDPTGGGCK